MAYFFYRSILKVFSTNIIYSWTFVIFQLFKSVEELKLVISSDAKGIFISVGGISFIFSAFLMNRSLKKNITTFTCCFGLEVHVLHQ